NEGKTGPWEELKGGVVLGSENFLDVVKPFLDNYQQDNEYPIYQRKAARPTLKELFANIKIDDKRERNGKIYEAVRVHGYTQTEVARFLGLHYSTVSVILKQKDSNS
ncbi:MAG: addiction module toxin RelE, partial [Acetomicrobium sp.]